jgi:hypothetical protein
MSESIYKAARLERSLVIGDEDIEKKVGALLRIGGEGLTQSARRGRSAVTAGYAQGKSGRPLGELLGDVGPGKRRAAATAGGLAGAYRKPLMAGGAGAGTLGVGGAGYALGRD